MMRTPARAVFFSLALALAALSCTQSSKPSEVARGMYFSAGSPDYDDFFVRVHRLQIEMAAAPSESSAARKLLADALVSSPDAPNALLAEKVKLALSRLADHGIRTRVEFLTPSPPDAAHTMATLTYSSPPVGPEREASERVEAGLTRVLRFVAAMRAARERLRELRDAVPRLEAGVDVTFREQSHGRRAQIHDNLRDAERVCVLMLARADQLARPAEELSAELHRAVAAYFEPLPLPPPPAPEPAPEPPRPRARGSSEARPRAGEPSKAKAASDSPKPADFEP